MVGRAAVAGGVCATVAWLWSEEYRGAWRRRQDNAAAVARGLEEAEVATKWRLPTPAAAAETQPVVIKGFLTVAEVQKINLLIALLMTDLGNAAQVRAEIKKIQAAHIVSEIERDMHGRQVVAGPWRTTYLHTDGVFRGQFPKLLSRCRDAMKVADATSEGWGVLDDRPADALGIRTAEFHEYGVGGKLSDAGHYDAGSLITLDIMLGDPDNEFNGGDLTFPASPSDDSPQRVRLQQGDAAVFLSHKWHNVSNVNSGKRTVLVLELWEGPDKNCAHRCLSRSECNYTLAQSQVGATALNVSMLG